jgi:hypothetical protein
VGSLTKEESKADKADEKNNGRLDDDVEVGRSAFDEPSDDDFASEKRPDCSVAQQDNKDNNLRIIQCSTMRKCFNT